MRRRTFLDLLAAGVAGYAVRPSLGVTAQAVAWHERLPKVELHLHLEGAIPKATLWELITKYGGDPAIKTREDLERALVYRDFGGFLKMWVWMIGYLREYDDYTVIGEAVARDLARQKIRYVEGFFSPPDYRRSKLDPQRVTQALRAGVNRVSSIEVALIADLVRDRGVEHARNLLERMGEVRNHGVIGIGIGGWEPGFPPELFEATFERARALGFRTTAHAGEAAGAASVWGAVRALRVDRIGHATRAAEDPELVKHLAAQRIPLELCPLSNVRTGIIKSVEVHPAAAVLRRWYSRQPQHGRSVVLRQFARHGARERAARSPFHTRRDPAVDPHINRGDLAKCRAQETTGRGFPARPELERSERLETLT
jgi:adenosine deaminase